MAKTKFLDDKYWYFGRLGKLIDRVCFKDGVLHGISYEIEPNTSVRIPVFYCNGINVTDEILNSVGDINDLTDEERLYLKIKFDMDLGPCDE